MQSVQPWSVLLCLAALTLGLAAPMVDAQTPLTTERIATGYFRPVDLQAAPGDDERLFVVEQRGDIHIIKNDVPQAGAFLSIPAKVSPTGNERGLFAMAFHPDYQSNGFFYVSYTQSSGHGSVIERYKVSANPDVADAGSGTIIFGPISQPFSNHNGGCIQFGPDGKIYLGLGDGGSGGDPGCRAQNPLNLMGKMIRLNADGTTPLDNPFVGNPNVDDRIWALGLRNPWKFTFDRETGDMYIGDVGQGSGFINPREEISFQPASSTGGENYGWKVMEGNLCFGTSNCAGFGVAPCNDPSYTLPFRVYGHGGNHCTVVGGYTYRGDAIPDQTGKNWSADYCSNAIWSIRHDNGSSAEVVNYNGQLDPPGATINQITAFGEDNQGELYFVDQGGEIFRLIPDGEFLGRGFALAGANGKPILWGSGSSAPGQAGALHLENAAPSAFAVLFISVDDTGIPAFGGTLLTFPWIPPLNFLNTDANGEILAAWSDLGVIPPGTEIFFQYAIADAGAPQNIALSNALQLTVP